MMQSKPERNEGFDVIIRPGPEGAGQTTPEQTGHYFYYNTKLTNSRYFHGNSYRIALTEPPSRPLVLGNPVSIVTPSVLK